MKRGININNMKNMKKHYGIPYMGSKEKMLKTLEYIFQRENNKEYFIDPFCGGFAVCSYILENKKFKVLANDLNDYVIALYKEILFNHSKEIKKVWFDWVNREKFFDVKNNFNKYPKWYVGYVLTIWSFGNHQQGYLFGKNREKIKEDAHNYLIKNGYKENQNKRIQLINEFKKKYKITNRFELQQLERLQQLEQLQRLERLDCIDWFDFINSIPKYILEKSFIYCDPPYQNTSKYQKNNIDYNQFWNWFRTFPYTVYVSSYSAPEDIKPINFIKKIVLLKAKKNRKKAQENIYFNGRGIYQPTMYDLLFNK